MFTEYYINLIIITIFLITAEKPIILTLKVYNTEIKAI